MLLGVNHFTSWNNFRLHFDPCGFLLVVRVSGFNFRLIAYLHTFFNKLSLDAGDIRRQRSELDVKKLNLLGQAV